MKMEKTKRMKGKEYHDFGSPVVRYSPVKDVLFRATGNSPFEGHPSSCPSFARSLLIDLLSLV
jgi:hypothetical protein